ncbi:ELL-associated factor 2-like [Cervus elaphus]|uniref:ELL-associated factor 2-like n=1 Tax=Cervus elaphus TaxID=9860 RepID=UPI001CC28DEE|nr:ELL-associated factor 2-like [Cervus elaphus]
MNGAAGPSHIDSRERVLKLGGSFETQRRGRLPHCALTESRSSLMDQMSSCDSSSDSKSSSPSSSENSASDSEGEECTSSPSDPGNYV